MLEATGNALAIAPVPTPFEVAADQRNLAGAATDGAAAQDGQRQDGPALGATAGWVTYQAPSWTRHREDTLDDDRVHPGKTRRRGLAAVEIKGALAYGAIKQARRACSCTRCRTPSTRHARLCGHRRPRETDRLLRVCPTPKLHRFVRDARQAGDVGPRIDPPDQDRVAAGCDQPAVHRIGSAA